MQLAFRRTAGYVRDVRAISTPLDRNARARLVWHAEQLERRTKLPGRRNGVLGYTSLAVLRALLFVFMNRQTGVTVPSYTALQCATGLCRQSIATALARLEAVGLVRVTRRLVRERRARVSPITGETELVLETRQTSNAYVVTLNPTRAIPRDKILYDTRYHHPHYGPDSVMTHEHLSGIQGTGGLWWAGAWTGYGFHEDGLKSGLRAVAGIDRECLPTWTQI